MKQAGVLILGASVLALAACGQDSAPAPESSVMADSYGGAMQDMASLEMEAPQVMSKQSRGRPAPSPQPPQPGAQDNPADQSYLAYRYTYGFSLPVKAVAATAQSHMQICLDAGPSQCQVLGSNTNVQSKEYVTANLRLRAAPGWLETYKTTLTTSVESAEGTVLNAGVTAEDLTRAILDTDARLKAQKLLRGRLEGLLETRNAKLSELLQLERELARVQGDIESQTTRLKVLRKRVSMSEVTVNYQTTRVTKPGKRHSPIGQAFKDFGETFSYSLASVIGFIAAILPWMVLVIPGLWLLRRWWRKRRIRKAAEPAKITRPSKA